MIWTGMFFRALLFPIISDPEKLTGLLEEVGRVLSDVLSGKENEKDLYNHSGGKILYKPKL